ncbi:uncharacterized protein LOC121416926 [Lytechinus variegatus]|uniref:uncharacterized protein LOC121416926 n=1 Tax=Lytechinus variegatus TaxID=7654 RepID=UPI001BB10433|nr:uncharacterized protein LOC121416926 [Lytechinus variegatus]
MLTKMATNEKDVRLQVLFCPLCLESFNKATLLNCGHTFCQNCLEVYDDKNRHLDHMVCPVCKNCTYLGAERVAELAPNYLVRNLEDDLHLLTETLSPNVCLEHSRVFRDILCEDCQEFVCLHCFLDCHQGHVIKKKEELDREFEDKERALVRQSDTRKSQIEKVIYSTEQHKNKISSHLNALESQIRDQLAQKRTILLQNETLLLDTVNEHRSALNKACDNWVGHNKRLIDNINSSLSEIRRKSTRFVDLSTLKAHNLLCSNLENLLAESVERTSFSDVGQEIRRIHFCPADDKVLELGCLVFKEVSYSASKTHGENQFSEEDDSISSKECNQEDDRSTSTVLGAVAPVEFSIESRENAVPNGESSNAQAVALSVPAQIRTYTLSIARKIDLAGYMRGIAALSPDSVVVGYGLNRNGADRFSVSGEKKQYLKGKVGQVWDIAFLGDGRSVVSHGAQPCKVYDVNNIYTGLQYTRKEGNNYFSLCSDRSGKIYAVNDNPEIYIFEGTNANPHQTLSTGNIKPEHICVTTCGWMITTTCCITPSRINLYDRQGHVGISLTASDNHEYLYAAVDSEDRVLVARVRERSTVFKLALYRIKETRLVEEKAFAPIKLPRQIKCKWCYMVSLTPNMLAFATLDHHLYFIELLM